MTVTTVSPETTTASPEMTMETIIKALHRLPLECLPDVLLFIEFLEHKLTWTPDNSSEDEALWAAVRAERAYRQEHPEDVIVCRTIKELDAVFDE